MKLRFDRQRDGSYKAVVYADRRDEASPDWVEIGQVYRSIDTEDEPWSVYMEGEGALMTAESLDAAKTVVEASVMHVISGAFGGS